MSESKTPRTDALIESQSVDATSTPMISHLNLLLTHRSELISFARTLESELTRLSAEKAEAQGEFERVEQKLKRIQADYDSDRKTFAAALKAAESALLQAREDAQRYQWLKQHPRYFLQVYDAFDRSLLSASMRLLDEQIDAARQAEPQEGEKG